MIAEASESGTDLLEENKALLAFALDDWEKLEDFSKCAEFRRLVRWQHLKRHCDRLCECEDHAASTLCTKVELEAQIKCTDNFD